MVQVIRGGAFLQQCWSVHPLCVTVKRVTEGGTVVLLCSSCRSAHHLQCAAIVAKPSAMPAQAEDLEPASTGVAKGQSQLAACIEAHAPALSLRQDGRVRELRRPALRRLPLPVCAGGVCV